MQSFVKHCKNCSPFLLPSSAKWLRCCTLTCEQFVTNPRLQDDLVELLQKHSDFESYKKKRALRALFLFKKKV